MSDDPGSEIEMLRLQVADLKAELEGRDGEIAGLRLIISQRDEAIAGIHAVLNVMQGTLPRGQQRALSKFIHPEARA